MEWKGLEGVWDKMSRRREGVEQEQDNWAWDELSAVWDERDQRGRDGVIWGCSGDLGLAVFARVQAQPWGP